MIQEHIPPRGDYDHKLRPEWQGALLSCTRFGLTSALESLAAAAGEPIELSVRYLWWHSEKASLSVQSAIDTLNKYGTCREDLYPYVASMDAPYLVTDIDEPPSLAAILDAQGRKFDVQAVRICGKEQCMRALAQGSRLITVRTNPSGTEHCEAAIDYDVDQGLLIHGSTYTTVWEPWDRVSTVITQVWAITKCPWPLIPHPDYIAGDLPTFADGVLSIPRARVYKGWPVPSEMVQNVRLKFTNFGAIQIDDPRVSTDEVVYFVPTKRLHLPRVIVGGALYRKVSLTGPVAELLSMEAA